MSELLTISYDVVDNTVDHRYDAVDDAGTVLGFVRYVKGDGVWALPGTRTNEAYKGHGVASAVVRHALDAAREAGVKVTTTCWYVSGYIERHPQYADLLAD